MGIRYQLDMQTGRSAWPVNYKRVLIFAGSCFSEHIADKLESLHFKIKRSANGIVFNPLSLGEPFRRILSGEVYEASDLTADKGIWHGLNHHGSFSGQDDKKVLNVMNDSLKQLKAALGEATHLFLTFGTSYAYYLDGMTFPVANCHKIPQARFRKALLEIDEMYDYWHTLLSDLKKIYPDLNVVLTVSPVKHLRDGISENLRSKSRLIELVHRLCDQYEHLSYFPAYELVSEDLRDYRFYAADAAHPNEMAVAYVFEKFKSAFLDAESDAFVEEIGNYLSMKTHRPIQTEGKAYEDLLKNLEQKRLSLIHKYGISL